MKHEPDIEPVRDIRLPMPENKRFWLFFATYLIAALIPLVDTLATYPEKGGSPTEDLSLSYIGGMLLFLAASFVITAIFLPYGLTWVLRWFGISWSEIFIHHPSVNMPQAANSFVSSLIFISYLSLFLLSGYGITTTRRRVFRILYIIFIVMLLIDTGGCTIISQSPI